MRLSPRIRQFLLASGIIALVAGTGMRLLSPEKAGVAEVSFLAEVAPGTVFGPKKGSPPHYESPDGTLAFNSYDVTPSIQGYNGPIKVLLSLSPEGSILGIRILEHRETKNYVHRLETPEFLRQFLGKHIRDPFEPERDIDGISRATVTVKALGETVRESSRRIAREVLGIDPGGAQGKGGAGLEPIICAALIALAVAGYAATRRSRRFLRMRDLCLAAALVVLGLWLSTPLSILHVLNMSLLRFPRDVVWLLAVPGILLTIVLFGRMYCGWLCPFGALAEFIGRIPAGRWSLPGKVDHRWRDMKYLLLWAVVVLVAATGRPDFAAFETYVTLFSAHGSFFAWALVALMLAANLRVPRFWCRYLCPVAALGGILSRNAPGYPSLPSCPMGNAPDPPGAECIRCNRCRRTDD